MGTKNITYQIDVVKFTLLIGLTLKVKGEVEKVKQAARLLATFE